MNFFDKFKLIIISAIALSALIGLIDTCPDKGEEWKGVVSEKYIDVKHHSYPVINVTNARGIKTVIFTRDASGFFDFVEIGDSVKKKSGSFDVTLKRNGITIIRKLEYGCK